MSKSRGPNSPNQLDGTVMPFANELQSALAKLELDGANRDLTKEDIEDQMRIPALAESLTADEHDALLAYYKIDLPGLGMLGRKTDNPYTLDALRAIERETVERMLAAGMQIGRPRPPKLD